MEIEAASDGVGVGIGVGVGYHIDDYGEGMPICARDSKGEALGEAIYRILSLGITTGSVAARKHPLSADARGGFGTSPTTGSPRPATGRRRDVPQEPERHH